MSDTGYAVVLVHSTGHALKAEKVIKGLGIVCKLIPVPRHLSSDCGVCVRIPSASQQQVAQALESAGVAVESIAVV